MFKLRFARGNKELLIKNRNLIDSMIGYLYEKLSYPKYPKVIRENTRNLSDDWKVINSVKDGIYTIEDSVLFDIEKTGVPEFSFVMDINLDSMTVDIYTELKNVSDEGVKKMGFRPYLKKGIRVPADSRDFTEMYISERDKAIKNSFR